jgi:uncharacterized membrane protein YbaN (DUF454 family)
MKWLFNLAGLLAVLLGVLGIFLPLLPTTPFLLLAAACFARGSARMHRALLDHPVCGAFISDFQQGKGIPARAKVLALLMMWSSLGFALWRYEALALRVLLAAIGLGVSIYLLRLPNARAAGAQSR